LGYHSRSTTYHYLQQSTGLGGFSVLTRAVRIVCLVGLAGLIIASHADAAPQQLMNKTITVGFGVSIPAKGSDGSTLITSRQTSRQIYVSTQSRVFVKVARRAGRASENKEVGPGDGGTTMRFVGNNLVGVLQFASGASQLMVTFDSSFQTCTASVIMGADRGKPIVWKGIDGRTYTSTGKPTVSGLICSIVQGNAFAG